MMSETSVLTQGVRKVLGCRPGECRVSVVPFPVGQFPYDYVATHDELRVEISLADCATFDAKAVRFGDAIRSAFAAAHPARHECAYEYD